MTGSGLIKTLLWAASFAFILGVTIDADAQQSKSAKKLPVNGTAVSFNFFPTGPAVAAIRDTWKTHPEYGKFWDKLNLLPDYSLGMADLNGDNKAELFVRHSSENWGYCDKKEFACTLLIYVSTQKGLVEIGKMMAADPVIVLKTKTNNIRDIYAIDSDGIGRTYAWNGKKYVLRK